MDPMQSCNLKLLALDLLSLTQKPSSSFSTNRTTFFYRKGRLVARVETLGIVVTRETKSNKFLKFTIDDSTGCIPCILWLNHLNSPYFSKRNPFDVQILSQMANDFASEIQLGVVVRVRGKITSYRGALQITVSDVVVERDPNAEILHWLSCVKLARSCYNNVMFRSVVPPPPPPPPHHQQQQNKKTDC